MRIEKLAASAAMSRKDFKKALSRGRVKVNGAVVKQSINIDAEKDYIELDGEKLSYVEFVYIMLHKPAGVISATEDNKQKTVLDLLPEKYKFYDLFPVGRLDIDTEGLLIITNDGQTAHNMLSPVKKVFKTYFVKTDLPVIKEDKERLERGIELSEGVTKPAKLTFTDKENEVYLSITEGKFHQVKRMFAAVGKKVIYLKRTEFGGLCLDNELKCGEFRELTATEIEHIRNIMQN